MMMMMMIYLTRWLVKPVKCPLCGVNIFITLWGCDRWADVDETWHVYSVGLGTQLLGSGILNFGPCAAPERWPTLTGVLIFIAVFSFYGFPYCSLDLLAKLSLINSTKKHSYGLPTVSDACRLIVWGTIIQWFGSVRSTVCHRWRHCMTHHNYTVFQNSNLFCFHINRIEWKFQTYQTERNAESTYPK